ncbi:MAG: Jag N-terminal domain-containing protein [Anaerolineae bacterium]
MSEPQSASKSKGGSTRGAVEVSARTVDEAIARGLVRLGGLSRGEVQIDILREGRSGLLGFGAEEALVRLTPLGVGAEAAAGAASPAKASAEPAEAAAPDSASDDRRGRRRRRPQGDDAHEEASAAPSDAAAAEERPAKPKVRTEHPPAAAAMADGDDATAAAAVVGPSSSIRWAMPTRRSRSSHSCPTARMTISVPAVLCIRGRGTERLLSDDAAALNALQFVTRLIVSRRANAWCNVLLDVDGDRRRRVKELLALASQSAELVESGGKPVSLPPMGAYERRVVHLALRDHPTVATQSIGTGTYRKVTVRGRDQMLPDL